MIPIQLLTDPGQRHTCLPEAAGGQVYQLDATAICCQRLIKPTAMRERITHIACFIYKQMLSWQQMQQYQHNKAHGCCLYVACCELCSVCALSLKCSPR